MGVWPGTGPWSKHRPASRFLSWLPWRWIVCHGTVISWKVNHNKKPKLTQCHLVPNNDNYCRSYLYNHLNNGNDCLGRTFITISDVVCFQQCTCNLRIAIWNWKPWTPSSQTETARRVNWGGKENSLLHTQAGCPRDPAGDRRSPGTIWKVYTSTAPSAFSSLKRPRCRCRGSAVAGKGRRYIYINRI